MDCPFCGSSDTQVKDSRPCEDGGAIRRRRLCSSCDARFTTFERVQLRELVVVKRNGKKSPFDRDKLERSLNIALRKRDVDPEVVSRAINDMIRTLEQRGEAEASTETIGKLVMQVLSRLDKVAYIRYASVYRNFAEAKDFENFVEKELGDL
ncbi:MAG: transcriptional regulator NrdR [Alphaproteobacteria bacterium]|nr:transcriptional regulator NrdR [Alphaproteobacteria bacterium]